MFEYQAKCLTICTNSAPSVRMPMPGPDGRAKPAYDARHFSVDNSHRSCNTVHYLALRRDVTGDGRLTERERCPRAGLVTSLPGGPGKTPGRHDDRPTGSPLDWDRRRRLTAVFQPRPRKRGLGLSGGVRSPKREPRWNADRRARPAGRAPHPMMRRLVLRLSAFCLPFTRKDGEGDETVTGASSEVANSEWWLLSIRHSPFATRRLTNSGASAPREREHSSAPAPESGRGAQAWSLLPGREKASRGTRGEAMSGNQATEEKPETNVQR
jgi:hypothetical protein